MKIIVTDGNNRAALAITRSLGKEGHELIVGAEEQPCLASVSRFCGKNFRYSYPDKSPRSFTSEIMDVVKREKPDVLLPVSEITTLLIMQNKDVLEKDCLVPFQSFDSVNRAASKYEILHLAQSLDIPIPKTFFLEKADDLSEALSFCRDIDFPIVLKPSRSRVANVDGFRATGVKYAHDLEDVKAIISDCHSGDFPLLIQERIYGAGIGLFACYNHGKQIAIFSHRRLREKPPSGGVSVLRESFPVNGTLKTYTDKLLKAINWHGVAMVEFKQDKACSDYKLMEVNGRFWGSLQLAIDAGVNFPSILVKVASEEPVEPITSYKINVKTRWLWGDIDALIARLLKSEKQLNLPANFPGKIRYFLAFLKLWGKNLNYEVFKLNDIKPWLFESRRWFLGK